MKLFFSHRQAISWLVLLTLAFFLQADTHRSETPVSSSRAEVSLTGTDSNGAAPNAVEKAATPKVKKRSFPWLIVGGVCFVGAIAAIFLLTKKKSNSNSSTTFTLTVTVGEGVEGSPASGTASYKEGTQVSYSYSLKAGYKKLSLTYDGTPANTSGSVTMDKDHTLNVSAVEGIDEQFDGSASANWRPKTPSAWTVGGGYYVTYRLATGTLFYIEYNVYDRALSKSDYVVQVKLRRAEGWDGGSDCVMLLTESAPVTAARGYMFQCIPIGEFAITLLKGMNLYTDDFSNPDAAVKIYLADTSAVVKGLNSWNVLRIIRNGSNYVFFINDQQVYSFTDSTYDPRYIALCSLNSSDRNLRVDYDSVVANIGANLSRRFVPMNHDSAEGTRPVAPFSLLQHKR
jgi:hypothetical protein